MANMHVIFSKKSDTGGGSSEDSKDPECARETVRFSELFIAIKNAVGSKTVVKVSWNNISTLYLAKSYDIVSRSQLLKHCQKIVRDEVDKMLPASLHTLDFLTNVNVTE